MTLSDVAVGQPHVAAHNAERHKINTNSDAITALQALTVVQGESIDDLGDTVAALDTTVEDLTASTLLSDGNNLQILRQEFDSRSSTQLSTAPNLVTVGTTPDGTLTKSYSIDVSGQADNSTTIATSGQLAQMPVDFGTPAFQKAIIKVGSTNIGYVFSSPSKDGNVLPSPSNALAMQELEFVTDAPVVMWLTYRPLGGAVQGQHILIEGHRYTERPQPGYASIVDYTIARFTDSKPRPFSIRTTGGVGAIYVAPGYDVWKPASKIRKSLYTIGDSYSAPTIFTDAGTGTGLSEEFLTTGIEDSLGIGDHYNDAVGGTGWTVRNSGFQGPNNNYQDRWPQVLRANPDVLFVPNGAANDCYHLVDPNTIAAAVQACFQSLRDLTNNKTIFIWADGFSPPLSVFNANGPRYVALRNLLIPLLSSIGVYYIDTVTDPWLYGTGNIGATTGDGNADKFVGSDRTHLTGLGYRYLKGRLLSKVRLILSGHVPANTVI